MKGAAKRIAFAAMVCVTAWSLWAWAAPSGARRGEAATATTTEQVAPEAEGPAPMNWFEFGKESPPFIAMIVNFAILVAGYYLLGKRPIAAALQSRRDSIAKQIEEADRMRREAEERAKIYQAKLDRLEDEVRTAREALVRAGEAERDRIVAEAQANAERMRKDADFIVEQEMKQIRQDLWRETLHTAIDAAEELLRRRVTLADHERLAEDYLTDLGAKPRPAAPPPGGVRPSNSGADNAP